MLGKLGIYLLLLVFAGLMAGLYGALHDQISYTVSPEYFTRFKFIQFKLPWGYEHPRGGAAIVGFLASWWMGVPIGLALGAIGFRFQSASLMFASVARSFLVVLAVALLTGLGGLTYGYATIDTSNGGDLAAWIWPGVTDPVAFLRVGSMHNSSYLGGVFGLIAGILFLFARLQRERAQNSTSACD